MSDFFDRLVARSRPGGALRARPRLPQRFERPVLAEQVEPEVPVARLAPTGPAPATAPDTAPPVTHTVEHVVQQRVSPPPKSETPAPAVVPGPVAGPDRPPAPRPAVAVPPATVPPIVVRETERAAPTVVRDRTLVLPSRPITVPRAVPPPDRRANEARPVLAPVSHRIPPRAPERVVRVSIGRVEVTAAAGARAPASEQRPTRPVPTMSLDKFLSGEDGRR